MSSSFDLMFTSFRIILYLLIGAIFFGLDLSHANVLSCLAILLLTIVSFSSLGILSAAFIMSVKRGDPIVWAFTMLNTLFGGVYFTSEVLPPFFQKISLLLPMTHSLRAFRRGLLHGTSLGQMLPEVGILIGFTIVTLPLALWAFKLAIRQAKRDGSLGIY
jgi:ABC-2 type transport system permease protein